MGFFSMLLQHGSFDIVLWSIWWFQLVLTSLLFKEGVLLEEEDPLLLGGLSTFILSLPLVLPFSLISPGLLKDTCSPFVWGEDAS